MADMNRWVVIRGMWLTRHCDWEWSLWLHPDRNPSNPLEAYREALVYIARARRLFVPEDYDLDERSEAVVVGMSPEQSRQLAELIDRYGVYRTGWFAAVPHLVQLAEESTNGQSK